MARIFKNDKGFVVMKKIKVVLLCHYWSPEAVKLVGMKHYFRELSPWIQETINLFKGKDDVELHVVAPNYTSNKDVKVTEDGIHYYFYKYSPSLLSSLLYPIVRYVQKEHPEPHKIAEKTANLLTGYRFPEKKIPQIVNKIKPDIVHLYGSENITYSIGAVPLLGKYPMLLTIQGFVYKANPNGRLWLIRKNLEKSIATERILNTSIKDIVDIGIADEDFAPYNVGQRKYKMVDIVKEPQIDAREVEKKYDIVFFASVDYDKGIEDLINSIGIIHREGVNLKTIVIGKCIPSYEVHLKELAESLGVKEQIDFAGFIDKHEDAYALAATAKVLVLPTHADACPSTVREAMFMHVAVVTNSVGTIPELNKYKECVVLTENGNIPQLVENIKKVLNDEVYRNMLIDNSYEMVKSHHTSENVYQQTIDAYRAVLGQNS